MAEITDVRIYRLDGSGKQKAFASITLDEEFAVHSIRVMEGDNGLWVGFPSRKDASGEFRDIFHPITKDSRDKIITAVLEAYSKET